MLVMLHHDEPRKYKSKKKMCKDGLEGKYILDT